MLKLYGKKNKKLTVDLSTVNELKENDKILIASNGKMKQIDQDLVNIGGGGSTPVTPPPKPEGVTSIGSSAFDGCIILTSVVIPSSVTSIGNGAFSNCRSMKSYHVKSATPSYIASPLRLFMYNPDDYVIYIPAGSLSAYTASSSKWNSYASHMVEES